MKHNLSQRLIAMLLVVATLIGLLAVPASAASLANSGSVKITMAGFGNYLSKKSGGTIGGGYWQYTSNDGLTGAAYCVNWDLAGVSPSKSLTIQPYNRNPQTMGAFANGFPSRSLEQFKQLHASDVRGIAGLTETEYKYATQVAVWATCGQIAVPGTKFTAGRTSVVEPTADAQQIRIFDSIKRILGHAENWDKTLYLGMYLHTEQKLHPGRIFRGAEPGLQRARYRDHVCVRTGSRWLCPGGEAHAEMHRGQEYRVYRLHQHRRCGRRVRRHLDPGCVPVGNYRLR